MLSLEDLLKPVDASHPAGKDLRYDALFDSIREARAEDDGTLPMGDWQHQTKRADHAAAIALAEDGLKTRSKDLWLAAWLGEAHLALEHHAALAPVLSLLRLLQERFWDGFHPAIDEDGDLSLRLAPLQWALNRYPTLVQQFPITADGIAYGAYRAVRGGSVVMHGEEALSVEQLDSLVAITPDVFYAGIQEQLTLALESLQELFAFCEQRYGEEGPSFVRLRSALEEVQHTTVQILRTRMLVSPPAPEPAGVTDHLAAVPPKVMPGEESPDVVAAPAPELETEQETRGSTPGTVQSLEVALELIHRCMAYVAEQQPGSPTAYLLALALQSCHATEHAQAPPSALRVALKQARESGNAQELLKQSLEAMAGSSGQPWLDLCRYAWEAAGALGATPLQIRVMHHTRALLQQEGGLGEAVFADDTPVANGETRTWLAEQVTPPVAAAEPPLVALSVQATAPEQESVSEQVQDLIAEGRLLDALQVLTGEATRASSGRTRFVHRLHAARLCLAGGHGQTAAHLLRELLMEFDQKHLDRWESSELLVQVLSLLLDSLRSAPGDVRDARNTREEWQAVHARLCRLDPALALHRSAAGEEDPWLVPVN